jgi:hypothetical protein
VHDQIGPARRLGDRGTAVVRTEVGVDQRFGRQATAGRPGGVANQAPQALRCDTIRQ